MPVGLTTMMVLDEHGYRAQDQVQELRPSSADGDGTMLALLPYACINVVWEV